MPTLNTAEERMAHEAREALRCHAARDLAGWELHRANARRIRDALQAWEQTGDYWAERFAHPEVRDMGGGRAYYRQCRTCGGHALTGSESAHARWCDAEQDRIRALQGAEIQQLRIRGLL